VSKNTTVPPKKEKEGREGGREKGKRENGGREGKEGGERRGKQEERERREDEEGGREEQR
jgi:hypothetical protein